MSTASTATKQKPKREQVQATNIEVRQIDPSPFQPRTAFPDQEIQELAESFEAHGQLVPILVRKRGQRFELVDGERRLRAAKRAGLVQVRAEVRELSDAEARAIVVVSAVQRKELGPLEEARAYQQLIDLGDASGPTEVARICGVSQGQVSNRLGLLALPENPWQAWIADGALPPTHARALSPWAKYPRILESAEERFLQWVADEKLSGDESRTITVENFRDLVLLAIADNSRAVDGRGEYVYEISATVPLFTPTTEERESLQIVEVPKRWGEGTEPRAMNVDLWDDCQKEHKKKWLRQHKREQAKREEAAGDDGILVGKSGTVPAGEPPAKPKKLSDEQRETEKRIWLENVVQWLIAQQVPRIDDAEVLRLLLLVSTIWCGDPLMPHDLAAAMGQKTAKAYHGDRGSVVKKALTLDASELADAARDLVARGFWDSAGDRPRNNCDDDHLVAVAATIGVDLQAAWSDGTLAPHYRAYLDLCEETELRRLADALDLSHSTLGRDSLVERILAAMPKADSAVLGPPLPKDLAQLWKKGQKLGKEGRADR